MHATIEQLLEIKDGLQSSAQEHVSHCGYCQSELAVLRSLRQQIFAAADQQPRSESWGRILEAVKNTDPHRQFVGSNQPDGFENRANAALGESRVDALAENVERQVAPIDLLVANSAQSRSNFNSLSKAIYCLAASIMLTGFIGLYIYGQQGTNKLAPGLLQANIQELMLSSRGMELALQKVALQNNVLTVAEQTLAERLYWRLTYVDQMIHENNVSDQPDTDRVETLWNDRIDALTELNQLYYKRQQTLDDSEI